MIKNQNQEAAFEVPSPHLQYPGRLLTEDELEIFRETANFLNRQCDRLLPIGNVFEERSEAVSEQRRGRGRVDVGAQDNPAGGSAQAATSESPAGSLPGSLNNRHSSDAHTDEDPSLSILGDKGRSGSNPIDYFVWHLRELTGKIERLCDTGTLQTISDQAIYQTTYRLSERGLLHAITDISIGPNDPPMFEGVHGRLVTDPEESRKLRDLPDYDGSREV